MVEYKKLRKRIFHEGVELASFFAEYPSFDDHLLIGDFYEDTVKRCFSWFCEKYYPRVLEEYIADENPKKRFEVLAYRYEIKYNVGCFNEDLISVKCEMRLCRGRKEVVAKYNSADNFDTSQNILISPKSALKRACHPSKRLLPFVKGKSIYIDELKRAFYFDGSEWINIDKQNL